MTIKPLKFVAACAVSIALLALSACADKANPDNVNRRAVERWNFLIAHQAEKAYDYLTPGFRQTQTRDAYATAMNNRPLQWKSAKFDRKDCEEDRCTVVLDVAYALKMGGSPVGTIDSSSRQTETWIRVDGDWYFLPK